MSDIAAVLARLDKITPGEWRADITGIGWYVFRGETKWPIASGIIPVWAATDPDDTHGRLREERANARAIALLPELIAVAKGAAELRKHPIIGPVVATHKAADALNAALSALAQRGME